ncbi:MAG: hypothetical protein ACE5PT_06095 [Gemmatimonadales bacterium]
MTGSKVQMTARRLPMAGFGWTRTAERIAESVAPDTIDRIWLFAPVRRDDREWGTAVVSCRLPDGRRRIHTASYLLVVRGRERGRGKVTVEEVGESPETVVDEVIVGVQQRAGEPDPPVEIAPELWYPDLALRPGSANETGDD